MSSRLENLLGALVLALSDAMSAAVGDAAGHAGAASAALAVLAQEPGLSIEQLRVPLGRTQSATVRLVDRLVADGLAERREGPDRRSVAVFPTGRGMSAAAEVLARRRAVLQAATGALAPGEQQALEHMLGSVLSALTTDAGQAEQICRLCDVAACPLRICPVELAAGGAPAEPGRPRPRPIHGPHRRQPAPVAAGPAAGNPGGGSPPAGGEPAGDEPAPPADPR